MKKMFQLLAIPVFALYLSCSSGDEYNKSRLRAEELYKQSLNEVKYSDRLQVMKDIVSISPDSEYGFFALGFIFTDEKKYKETYGGSFVYEYNGLINFFSYCVQKE